ncbi:alpha/beta fold hydrolase [Streptomyces sp. NBC_01343]|uniref:alpha/beta hydrolase n=1 Tax=Streptomyces sp. NBC_01343 TaxID=2903832 RepID=UPI002E0D358C|nr:alpha/beta fold hydrolase [Streptomyces sp. NBC_01343]
MRGPTGALVLHRVPQDATAAVLLLHGGRAQGLEAPPRPNLPGLRMRPFARSISGSGAARGVVVAEVRYEHRGWNGNRADPVHDVWQALRELCCVAGPLPVVLVGHSMGGRAALRAAADPLVRAVVGLAPWCPPGEPVLHLGDTAVVLLHDEADRVTDARGSWDYVRRARARGARAAGIAMPYGGHAMLRRAPVWHRVARDTTLGLLGLAPLPETLFTDRVPAAPGPPLRLPAPGGSAVR